MIVYELLVLDRNTWNHVTVYKQAILWIGIVTLNHMNYWELIEILETLQICANY